MERLFFLGFGLYYFKRSDMQDGNEVRAVRIFVALCFWRSYPQRAFGDKDKIRMRNVVMLAGTGDNAEWLEWALRQQFADILRGDHEDLFTVSRNSHSLFRRREKRLDGSYLKQSQVARRVKNVIFVLLLADNQRSRCHHDIFRAKNVEMLAGIRHNAKWLKRPLLPEFPHAGKRLHGRSLWVAEMRYFFFFDLA
jgi:hypothetical protein